MLLIVKPVSQSNGMTQIQFEDSRGLHNVEVFTGRVRQSGDEHYIIVRPVDTCGDEHIVELMEKNYTVRNDQLITTDKESEKLSNAQYNQEENKRQHLINHLPAPESKVYPMANHWGDSFRDNKPAFFASEEQVKKMMELGQPYEFVRGYLPPFGQLSEKPWREVWSQGENQPKGTEKTFSTGAKRSTDADEFGFTLFHPEAMFRRARVWKRNSLPDKYGCYNWEKGMSVRECLEHALQHIFDYLAGDRSEDHLANLGCNADMAMVCEKMPEMVADLRGPNNSLTPAIYAAFKAHEEAKAALKERDKKLGEPKL